MTLQEMFLHGAEFAAHSYEKLGYVAPMWVGETEDGEHVPIQSPLMSAEISHAVAENVRELFHLNGVVQYVSMIEGWMVTDEEAPIENDFRVGDKTAASHPRRREVILINASDGAEKLFGFYWITRDGDKAVLSEFNINDRQPEDTGKLSPFDNLLDFKREKLQ